MTDLPEFNPEDYDREVIEPELAVTDRSVARRIALQSLYEIDAAGHNPGQVIAIRLQEEQASSKAGRYVQRLVTGVLEHRQRLDGVIQGYAQEWPLDQVAIVDRNILRMAVYELVYHEDVPVGVVISEAVELARLFGAEGASRFVNGVLASLVNDQEKVRNDLAPRDGGQDGVED